MAEKTGKILAVDDNEDILFSLKLLLKKYVETIHTEINPHRIPDLMAKEDYDVILLDMNFTKDAISGKEGFDWLQKILEIDPDAVVLFITAYGDTEKAVQAIKAGAVDFILKPWQNEKILATISSAVQLRRSRKETDTLKQKQKGFSAAIDQPFQDFIGVSPGMLDVFSTIRKVAKTDASMLILGENGTGKEVVARALHRESMRADEIFVSVDLGAIAETLFESELFGHEKGAFTDAKGEKPGRFEIASGGTLFLDEIGNLSLPLQAKLLTVIERREVTRVGANKARPFDIRLICATNASIYELVAEGKFRQDLLYRINTVEIHLPPLRERIEDISLLAEHFLKSNVKKYRKNIKGISPAGLRKLEQYSWPGNIRELQHAIERAVIMGDGNRLEADDFILSSPRKVDEFELENYNLDEVEHKIINRVMQRHKGNVSHAAAELGLTRTSLYRRLEKYGL
ncbi:MAG: sigma-54 dependent transcriptional regulator [Bacteroidales bacterium]|nr:sigma-54 dependent transcriptional regulator [Bacteroidales bacterium]MCF8457219.1 sigma-54 dependent transcriptional regulator [Bacteroidales bacterium]